MKTANHAAGQCRLPQNENRAIRRVKGYHSESAHAKFIFIQDDRAHRALFSTALPPLRGEISTPRPPAEFPQVFRKTISRQHSLSSAKWRGDLCHACRCFKYPTNNCSTENFLNTIDHRYG
ncbi:MAG: hypothetical protein QFF03_12485 [Pseudomonadota bacterium]|nr:hypothetical protein [Pseudomonadota bacterium]